VKAPARAEDAAAIEIARTKMVDFIISLSVFGYLNPDSIHLYPSFGAVESECLPLLEFNYV
jgi:hypothetical protein